MKVIIAGSRSITDPAVVRNALDRFNLANRITMVVSGAARGVDTLGAQWAAGVGISVYFMPANWEKFGKSAGYVRNRQMAKYADALLAIWDGYSKDTKNMIEEMNKLGKEVLIYQI